MSALNPTEAKIRGALTSLLRDNANFSTSPTNQLYPASVLGLAALTHTDTCVGGHGIMMEEGERVAVLTAAHRACFREFFGEPS